MMWTSYNDDGTLVTYDKQTQDLKVYEVVSDTVPDYEAPDNATVKNGFWDNLQYGAGQTLQFADDIASNLADGARAITKSSKYAPYLILAVAIAYIIKSTGGLKKWI